VEPINYQDPSNILLINPPVGGLACPPWAPAWVAGLLSGSGLSFEQYDANLDFFLNYLLTPKRLNVLLDLIRKKEKSGIFDNSVPYVAHLLADLAANPTRWTKKITKIVQSQELLRTEGFYRPESCMAAIKNINDLLDLASLAFHPSHIQRDRFSNPDVMDWFDFGGFVEDPDINPFLSFYQDRLAPKLTNQGMALMVLFVSSPNQAFAALTMAHFGKKERPDLHVALMGDPVLPKSAIDYVDTLLPETDYKMLMDLINRLWGTIDPVDSVEPDFSDLPLKNYLAPVVVLPFRAQISPKADLMAPSSLFAFLKKQKKRYGAMGFFSIDERLTPSYMAQLADVISREHEPIYMGLTCPLDNSTTKEQMNAAYQAGMRIIRWRDPIGNLESLTKVLWNVANSGVWNHLEIQAGRGDSVSQGLVHFMEVNPNIVHSSTCCQLPDSPLKSHAEQVEMASGIYSKVAKLPGGPFWKKLNDPVYFFLYLLRYGIEKVIQWRLRNDGCSIYRIGKDVEFHFVKPSELPAGYMDEICRMVEAGGSVGTKWVRYNLERAFLIGYVLEQGVIIGNSSLKRPRPEYVEMVKGQSGLDLSQYLERGYTSVRPEYRGLGIGTKLLEGLTSRAGQRKIFSIISEDNVATKKIAIRNRTRKVAGYYSERLGKRIGVWMPEWMIED